MKKRILAYRKRIDSVLAGEIPAEDWQSVIDEHLVQIGFFQHERLIHLIVTVLFALMAVGTVLAEIISGYTPLFILFFPMLVLLIPYIKHYYLLENEVQRMYEQYDKMLEKKKNASGGNVNEQ